MLEPERRPESAVIALPIATNSALIRGSDHPRERRRFMAIRIKARQNESIGQMLRRFKKLCEKEGLTKDIKRRQYFEKPSERRRRAQRKAVQRINRVQSGPRR